MFEVHCPYLIDANVNCTQIVQMNTNFDEITMGVFVGDFEWYAESTEGTLKTTHPPFSEP
jgi:hypothetical protein